MTTPKPNTTQIITRSAFDPDIYHLGYQWHRSNGKVTKRLACTIHIDDIEGMFGTHIYSLAKRIPVGGWDWFDLGEQ